MVRDGRWYRFAKRGGTRELEAARRPNPTISSRPLDGPLRFVAPQLETAPPSMSHDPHNSTDLVIAMEEGGPHVGVINSVVNGYGAEIERTFFLNPVPDEAHRPFDAVMEARRTAST